MYLDAQRQEDVKQRSLASDPDVQPLPDATAHVLPIQECALLGSL